MVYPVRTSTSYMILQQLSRNLETRISYLTQQELTSKRLLQTLYRFVVQLLRIRTEHLVILPSLTLLNLRRVTNIYRQHLLHVYYEIWFHHRYGADDICRGTSAVRTSSERIYRPAEANEGRAGHLPLNGADENSLVVTTVDFALTYFVVSGELERSGVPLNLVINDAGGLPY